MENILDMDMLDLNSDDEDLAEPKPMPVMKFNKPKDAEMRLNLLKK